MSRDLPKMRAPEFLVFDESAMPVKPSRYAKCCGTCEYWDDLGSHISECRRNSPVMPFLIGDMVQHPVQKWPGTYHSDWCGEWSLSPDAEPLEEQA